MHFIQHDTVFSIQYTIQRRHGTYKSETYLNITNCNMQQRMQTMTRMIRIA